MARRGRCDESADRAESWSRRSRDPRPHSPAAAAVAPVRRAAGGIASTNARASCESFRFAPVRRTASGTPRPSQIRWRLLPRLARSVGFGPRVVNLVVAREPIQERKVDQIPHARQLPVAHATPARHPRPAPEFVREHLPGNTTTKDENNAGQARAIRDARRSPCGRRGRIGKRGSTRSHNGSGSNAAAMPVHATSPTEIEFRRFCYTLLGRGTG
jgi:hypothetical protein